MIIKRIDRKGNPLERLEVKELNINGKPDYKVFVVPEFIKKELEDNAVVILENCPINQDSLNNFGGETTAGNYLPPHKDVFDDKTPQRVLMLFNNEKIRTNSSTYFVKEKAVKSHVALVLELVEKYAAPINSVLKKIGDKEITPFAEISEIRDFFKEGYKNIDMSDNKSLDRLFGMVGLVVTFDFKLSKIFTEEVISRLEDSDIEYEHWNRKNTIVFMNKDHYHGRVGVNEGLKRCWGVF